MNCSECIKELSTEELNKKIRCDVCKSALCQNCSSLSGTEIRVMQLVGKRFLSFTCDKCKNKDVKTVTCIYEEFSKKFEDLEQHFSENLCSLKQHMETTISTLQNEIINLRESNIELIHLLNVKCSTSLISPKGTGNIIQKETVNSSKPLEQKKTNNKNIVKQNVGENVLLADQSVKKPSYSRITASQVNEAVNHAVHANLTTNNEPFKTVRYKNHNSNKKVMRGTAIVPEEELFKSVPSKMWLYIGKVNNGVTVDIIRAYIKKKATIDNDEYLVVEQLKTIGNLSAFKIGVNNQFYDKLNSSEFWPDGTIYRRFNFKRKPVQLSKSQNWDNISESNSKLSCSAVDNFQNISTQQNFPKIVNNQTIK